MNRVYHCQVIFNSSTIPSSDEIVMKEGISIRGKTIFFLFGPSMIAERVVWNRVCPSVLLPGRFLLTVSVVFYRFWLGARNLYKVLSDRAGFFGKKFFCPKNWENGTKTGQKQGFLKLLKNLSLIFIEFNQQWKFNLFALFLHKSHIWENFGSWHIGQNVLSQSGWNSPISCMLMKIHIN